MPMLSMGVSLPDANTFMFALSHSTLECVTKPWHNVALNSQQPWLGPQASGQAVRSTRAMSLPFLGHLGRHTFLQTEVQ